MPKRVLVLDNSTHPAIYRPVDEWSRNFGDVPFDAVHVPSREPVPPLDRFSHLLVTGSEASVCDPRTGSMWRPTSSAPPWSAALSVLGSCFGHQMLAWALSGRGYVRRALTPELGWVAIDILAPDPLLVDLPTPWHTFAAHLDEVVDPPAPWRVLAANRDCTVQTMRYGDRPIWGLQPHPETSPEEARNQMQAGISQHPEYEREIRAAIASPIRDDRTAPKLAAAFLACRAKLRREN